MQPTFGAKRAIKYVAVRMYVSILHLHNAEARDAEEKRELHEAALDMKFYYV